MVFRWFFHSTLHFVWILHSHGRGLTRHSPWPQLVPIVPATVVATLTVVMRFKFLLSTKTLVHPVISQWPISAHFSISIPSGKLT